LTNVSLPSFLGRFKGESAGGEDEGVGGFELEESWDINERTVESSEE
jgi:hypothetical protein